MKPVSSLLAKRAGVMAELHMYAGGPHGFGVRDSNQAPYGAWIGFGLILLLLPLVFRSGTGLTVIPAGTPGAPSVQLKYTYDAMQNLTSTQEVIGGVNAATTN